MSTDISTNVNTTSGAMVDVASSRAAQETQAAMTVAKRFPRDETAAIARIQQSCKRQLLAEQAIYTYPRGGTKVTGPSIRLAEAMAQAWGNLDFGVIELTQENGHSEVMAYCWDLETNTRQTKVFTVKHERHTKKGVTHLDDPRDVYETVANQGARRLRACILGVIPGDVQDLAVAECRKTLAGNNSEPLVDRVRKMIDKFGALSVTQEMLEKRLGYKVSACDEHDLVNLRSIYTSLKDGMSKREDWFDLHTHVDQVRAAKEQQELPTSTVDVASDSLSVLKRAAISDIGRKRTPDTIDERVTAFQSDCVGMDVDAELIESAYTEVVEAAVQRKAAIAQG